MAAPDDLKQLAPTGKLRAGVVTAPAGSTFFAVKDDSGAVRGVTVDLLRGFAEALKLPLELQVFANSGQVTDAVAGGTCDVAFMPHDAARAEKVDFGPAYFIIESTYLVPAGSSDRQHRSRQPAGCAHRRHRQHHNRPQRAPHGAAGGLRGSGRRRPDGREGAQRAGRRLRAHA